VKMVLLVLCGFGAFLVTARLWKWYDAILRHFSPLVRIIDLFTWGLLLWFIIGQYQKVAQLLAEMLIWRILFYLLMWLGITVIGFMIIGLLRLFVKTKLFN
jgi:hypothetical protein